MNFEHDLCGPFPREGEEQLQYLDHELHRGVVVVVHHHLVHRWRLDLRLARLQYGRSVGFLGHLKLQERAVRTMSVSIWITRGAFSSPSRRWRVFGPRPGVLDTTC